MMQLGIPCKRGAETKSQQVHHLSIKKLACIDGATYDMYMITLELDVSQNLANCE